MTTLDIKALRADTPSCEKMVHFNNAGASIMPNPVYEAVTQHLAQEQKMGGYEAAAQAKEKVEGFYTNFATLLNAHPDEISYVENATRSWDMAVYAIPFEDGDRILTHESEYASNYLAFLQLQKTKGVKIDLIPSDPSGQIDVDAIAPMIKPQTKAIAITHVPSQGGLVNPAAAVGKIAREYGLIYVLDACQSMGQMPVDVQEIGCDILSGTGRKFMRGPRGTGFLYVSKRILDTLHPPFIDLHAAQWIDTDKYELQPNARCFESWERYVAGQIGLAEAANYALNIGLENIQERIKNLSEILRTQLATIPGIILHDQGIKQCGIVTFSIKDKEAQIVVKNLRTQGINTSATLRQHARLDLEKRNLSSLVRASVHYYNTEEEVEIFCEAAGKL